MGTTVDKLNYLLATKDEIKAAITAKGVDVSSSTFRECAQKIREIPQEVNVLEPTITEGNANVRFIDYDGTLIHSYTKDEFLALTEMPALPSRPRLVCKGWNYTLEDVKAFVEEYDKCDIGATYITDDGKTRLYITIAAEGRMDVPLQLQQSVSNGVVVDWGDGSATETFSSTSSTTLTHTYGKVGDYVITLEVVSGTLTLAGSSSTGIIASSMHAYSNMLRKVEIGDRISSIGKRAFRACFSLSSIVIPNGVTSIGDSAFFECSSLASIVIPNGVTSIGDSAFTGCYSLSSIVIPNGVTRIGDSAFFYCYSLSSLVIPNSVTSIGSDAFFDCSSLSSVVIPNGVTSIEYNAFNDCHSLASIVIPNGATSIGSNAFSSCYSLASVVIPNGVTSIGESAFSVCSSLASVVITNGVPSIGKSAFSSCSSLASVVIPNSVVSIGDFAFSACYSLAILDFSSHTSVPTLSGTNAFQYTASDFKIIVPYELYDEWIAATNWSTYASYIVKAPLKGVFIQHVNGSLHTEESWTSGGFGNDKANGVAVVTDNARFVIAKSDLGKMPWSSNTSTAVDGIMLTSDEATAKTDFAGYNNTQLMLATDTSGAGYSCANFTFPNGDKGYLPALGELNEAYANKSKIDSLMTKIGGVKLQSSYYWSSTQYNSYTSWILGWNNGNADYYSKYATTYYVRAFSALSL